MTLQCPPCCFPQLVSVLVTREMVEAVLGPPKYNGPEALERVTAPGTAAGLVWTAAGGKVQVRLNRGSVSVSSPWDDR